MKLTTTSLRISSTAFWTLFALTLVFTTGVSGTVCASNQPIQIVELSTITNSNHISAIQVIGDLCYLSDHGNGLKIYNISNPRIPVLLGETFDSGIYHDMYIEGDLAFFADLEDGLVVFDISTPSNPTRVGSYNVGEQNAAEIQAIGDLVYLAEFGPETPHGLEIFNVSDPENITKVGDYRSVTMSYCVQTIGDYCYITGGQDRLIVLNVSDPSNLEFIGDYTDSERVRYFYVNDGLAYVTCWDDGFKIIDLSDPYNPQLLGQYKNLGIVIYIHQIDNYVFVGDWDEGLAIFDVSDPTSPLLVDEYKEQGGVSAVHATSDYVFVGAMNTLVILEIIPDHSSQSTPYFPGVLGIVFVLLFKKKHP